MRARKGATLALVIVISLVLTVIGIAILFLTMLFSGQKELHNAVDAGNLQVSVTALDSPRVYLEDFTNPLCLSQFAGVSIEESANRHYIGLRTINRVWAQVMLAFLNSKQLTDTGLATPETYQHAQDLYTAAHQISNALTQKLRHDDENVLKIAFSDMAGSNSLRMLGTFNQSVNTTGTAPSVSYFDKNTASNLRVPDNQGVNWSVFPSTQVNGQSFLTGYAATTVSGGQISQPFAFVPLGSNQKPHLISKPDFMDNKSSAFLASLSNTVPPNSFSFATGNVQEQKTGQGQRTHSVSFAVSKDNGRFPPIPPGFPRGFVRLKNMDGLSAQQIASDSGRPLLIGEEQNLHILDYTNRAVGQIYQSSYQSLGFRSAAGKTLFARTALNPVQQPWGLFADWSWVNMIRCAICIPMVGQICSDCDDMGPLTPICRFFCCCFYKFPVVHPAFGPFYSSVPIFTPPKMDYGYYPCVDSSCREHPTNNLQLGEFQVTPNNIAINRILYDWEGNNYGPTFIAALIDVLVEGAQDPRVGTGQPGIAFFYQLIPIDWDLIFAYCFHALLSQDIRGENLKQYADVLPPKRVPAGHAIADGSTGMRLPLNPSSTGSMFWNGTGASSKTFSQDATINDLLWARHNDPNVSQVITSIKQRIHQISTDISDSEINGILSSSKLLKMGQEAYIYMGSGGHLEVGVRGIDTLPAWLNEVVARTPDSNVDGAADLAHPTNRSDETCYKMLRPTQDFPGYQNWTFDNQYPVEACNQDLYRVIQCTGYDGLLAVVELRSKNDKKCGAGSSQDSWSEPIDCYPANVRNSVW